MSGTSNSSRQFFGRFGENLNASIVMIGLGAEYSA